MESPMMILMIMMLVMVLVMMMLVLVLMLILVLVMMPLLCVGAVTAPPTESIHRNTSPTSRDIQPIPNNRHNMRRTCFVLDKSSDAPIPF